MGEQIVDDFSPVETLKIYYGGIIPSMKNSRDPVTVGKGDKKRTIYRKNDKVVAAMRELKSLAEEARTRYWKGEPLPKEAVFSIVVQIYTTRYKGIDVDGVLNTVLDALQGTLYKNDERCVSATVEKWVSKEYRDSVRIIVDQERW